ncbi:MAG: IclR family transcriptional regulator, partial [Firmicutes bacterium]|nr:IclR family transcriptional regulator [Bacillota bacterium]
ILDEIARNQSEMGVSDLARKLDLPKSTVHGIIQAFIDLGVLNQDNGKKYRLGPTLSQLGNLALAGKDLRLLARPFLEELCRVFKETIFLGAFDGEKITIIEKVDSPLELKISAPVGARIPIFAGAAGKVFLAGLSKETLSDELAAKSIPKYTQYSITDPAQYANELEKVKEQGFATDFQEYIQGVNAVCVPISNTYNRVLAAIWMVGFANTFDKNKAHNAITAMLHAAKEITAMMSI